METSAAKNRRRHFLHVLRPLIWWLLLVLGMYAIRTHQRLSAQTHLSFAALLQGQPVSYEVTPSLENDPSATFASGSRIPIGWHQLTLRHPKAEPFTTNLFIWYGEHDLGKIALTRATGSLIVKASPPAGLIEIRGPEYSIKLTNSPGITVTVPTDRYTVHAYYRHWQQGQETTVSSFASGAAGFSPRLGAFELTCNQAGAVFRVLNAREQLLETGELPATLQEMPEGTYKLVTTHHGNLFEQAMTVKAGGTNRSEVRISYGKAVLETVPPGATVYDLDGRELGLTPLALPEVRVGPWEFTLRLNDYDMATGSLSITADGPNHFHTNLISHYYTLAMENARRAYAGQEYDRAVEAASEALKHRPDDSAALNLGRDATGQVHLARAQSLAQQGDFSGAIKEVNAALKFLPGKDYVSTLLAGYQQREAEQAEAQKLRHEQELGEQQARQQLRQIHEVFNALAGGYENAPMFSQHELIASNLVNGFLGAAINNALSGGEPTFKILDYKWPRADTFTIQARHFIGLGYRECLIVGGQVRPGEARVVFKVFEYEHLPDVSLFGGLLNFSARFTSTLQDSQSNQQYAEKMHQRVMEGLKLVRERIQKGLAQ